RFRSSAPPPAPAACCAVASHLRTFLRAGQRFRPALPTAAHARPSSAMSLPGSPCCSRCPPHPAPARAPAAFARCAVPGASLQALVQRIEHGTVRHRLCADSADGLGRLLHFRPTAPEEVVHPPYSSVDHPDAHLD